MQEPQRIHGLDHVAYHVADVERSLRFFVGLLGADELPRPGFSFPGAWLRLGSTELHLIGGRKDGADGRSRGDHVAFAVSGIEAWAERLRDAGIAVRGPGTRPDGWRQIFLEDPDGHVLELNEPPA